MELTKLDVAALRKADALCLDHNVLAGTDGTERASFIRAIKRRRPTETDPYATDITHRFMVDSRVRAYDNSGGTATDGRTEHTAYHMVHHADAPNIATVTAFIRAGDRITLEWVRGNSTPNLDAVNLHRDEVSLTVERGGKRHTFLIYVQVSPNNSARMVQILP